MASMNPNPFAIAAEKSAPAPAAPPVAIPPPAAQRAVEVPPLVPPVVESGGSFGTWTDKIQSPDFSSSVRDAVRKLRRAHLSRVVRSVMIASLIVCVAATTRVAVSAVTSHSDPQVSPVAHFAAKDREAPAMETVHDDRDVLSGVASSAPAAQASPSAPPAQKASRGAPAHRPKKRSPRR
jgi:hypothetical protein